MAHSPEKRENNWTWDIERGDTENWKFLTCSRQVLWKSVSSFSNGTFTVSLKKKEYLAIKLLLDLFGSHSIMKPCD